MINPSPTEIVASDFFRGIGAQFSRAKEKPDGLDPTLRRDPPAGSRSLFPPECRAGKPAVRSASRTSPCQRRRCRCADREARLALVPAPCSLSYPATLRRRYLLRLWSARRNRRMPWPLVSPIRSREFSCGRPWSQTDSPASSRGERCLSRALPPNPERSGPRIRSCSDAAAILSPAAGGDSLLPAAPRPKKARSRDDPRHRSPECWDDLEPLRLAFPARNGASDQGREQKIREE